MKKQNATKRKLFAEVVEGVGAMKAHREGKVTLRTHSVAAPEIKLSPGAKFFASLKRPAKIG